MNLFNITNFDRLINIKRKEVVEGTTSFLSCGNRILS